MTFSLYIYIFIAYNIYICMALWLTVKTLGTNKSGEQLEKLETARRDGLSFSIWPVLYKSFLDTSIYTILRAISTQLSTPYKTMSRTNRKIYYNHIILLIYCVLKLVIKSFELCHYFLYMQSNIMDFIL